MDNYRIMNGLVDNATSETLNAPDRNAMQEVSELVRARADMPKEVIKLINSKLMKRDKKVTMLSLELLEYLTYTCEITLFNQIATKDFLIKMGNVLRYNDLGEQVILRACCLIKCWRELFNKDLHQFFFQFYDNLIKKGIEIPSNYVSPYAGLRSNLPATSSSFGSNNFKPSSQPFGQSKTSSSASSASGPNAKLKSDLELIKKNITAVNEMIDSQDPRGNVDQNYELTSLVQTIKNSEKMTVSLIEKLALENEEDLLSLCLQINDDMQDTFERHQSLRRHQKPKPFRGQKVEDEVIKQIEQLEISSKINTQSQASIFAETAQNLSQGLQQAQQSYAQKLPPPMQPPVQPPQPQKPVANLIDLLDDDEPVTVPQKTTAPTSFPTYPQNPPVTFQQPPQQFQQPPQQFQQPPQQFQQPPQQFQQPPQQFQQPPQQFQQPPQNVGLTQLYQQQQQQQPGYPPQQQQQQQQQQNKYAALNQIGQPQIGGYNPAQYNPNIMGQQGYGNPQQFGYSNPQQPAFQPQQQPTGYGVPPMNNGYGATTTFTSPPVVGGYGGGLPNQNKPGYGAPAVKKSDAFDDLDDMFGIGGNSAPSNNKPAQQPQAAKQVDFDLF